jgi:hypothetical protein
MSEKLPLVHGDLLADMKDFRSEVFGLNCLTASFETVATTEQSVLRNNARALQSFALPLFSVGL